MSDELLATPDPEPTEATPEPEATEPEPQEAASTEEGPESDDEERQDEDTQDDDGERGGEAAAETAEFEVDGEVYEVPKKLEAFLLRDRDYRQKTQAVADQRRQVESDTEALKTERESFEQTRDAQLAIIDDIAELKATEADLAQYQNLNWDQLEQENPELAQQHFRRFSLLQAKHQETKSRVEGKQQEAANTAQQDYAKRLGQARDYAAKEIPGWGAQAEQEIVEFGKEQGITADQIRQTAAINPVTLKILHLAMQGHRANQQRRANAKPKPTPVKPVTKVKSGGAAASRGPTDNQSIDTWMARRNKETRAQ